MEVAVRKIDDVTFEVTVASRTTTTHTVTVIQPYYQKLTNGKVTPEKLIERSFEFLLDRESNTSILRRFDLPVIQTYFPEYEKTIQKWAR